MKHDRATRKRSRALYGQGWSLASIARECGVTEPTLRTWRDTDGWAVTLSPEEVLEARLAWLINKDDKTTGDWTELKRLNELRNTMVRREARKPNAAHESGQRNPSGKGKKDKPGKNEIGHIDLDAVEGPPLFAYQQEHRDDRSRVRWTIKSRQIGWTYGVSWEALEDGIRTGDNWIFLSASKAQVAMFHRYIRELALEYLSLELKGSKERIELRRHGKPWTSFIFLSTNTATAQSYHGNVVIDEACWIPQYETLRKVAGGMAAHKQYRVTIFSTPSTVAHPAWLEFKRLQKERAAGRARGVSLRIVTLHDAMEQGCDLFDIEALRDEYDETAFAQLFECIPIDDELSIFKLAKLEALQVDPDTWRHPPGTPVYIGYDPSRFRDAASVALCVKLPATDAHPRGKWRVWKRFQWDNKSFRWQAEQIRKLTESHNVQGIGIDTSGMGQAVLELVQAFYPKARGITYTIESKSELVQGVRDLVDLEALELPVGDMHLLHAFLAIKQVGTPGGRITFKAGRTAETGHADAFFAVSHAVSFEPLKPRKKRVLIA